MEQPPEEAPEVREEEKKKEVAEAEGGPELNGGPEHSLPSSSCTGARGTTGRDGGRRREPGPARSIIVGQSGKVVKDWARQPGVTLSLISCRVLSKVPPSFL